MTLGKTITFSRVWPSELVQSAFTARSSRWVAAQEEASEGLLGIRLQRPVSVDEPAVAVRDKRLQAVYEDSPEGAEDCVALTSESSLEPGLKPSEEGRSKITKTLR